jgi:hypothetical protein
MKEKELAHNPLSVLDNLVRTLMMVGAIFIGSLLIANPLSWLMKIAMVALMIGFMSFTLTLQFLITIEMGNSTRLRPADDEAKDARLGIPFFLGYFSYVVAGALICIYFVAR